MPSLRNSCAMCTYLIKSLSRLLTASSCLRATPCQPDCFAPTCNSFGKCWCDRRVKIRFASALFCNKKKVFFFVIFKHCNGQILIIVLHEKYHLITSCCRAECKNRPGFCVARSGQCCPVFGTSGGTIRCPRRCWNVSQYFSYVYIRVFQKNTFSKK